jgi:hypothetical protein
MTIIEKHQSFHIFNRYVGGDGGIRTLDRALQPYNGLANRRLQPLGHISGKADMPDAGTSRKRQIAACRIHELLCDSAALDRGSKIVVASETKATGPAQYGEYATPARWIPRRFRQDFIGTDSIRHFGSVARGTRHAHSQRSILGQFESAACRHASRVGALHRNPILTRKSKIAFRPVK